MKKLNKNRLEKKMAKSKFLTLIKNNLLNFAILLIVVLSVSVFAANIIVKDGEMNIEKNFIVNGSNLFVNTSSGNVGIGTTTPPYKLYVTNNVDGDPTAMFENEQSDASEKYTSIRIKDPANWYSEIRGVRAGNLAFLVGGGGTPVEAMRILSTGYVGIGRSPTANKLEVEGGASKTTAGDWVANSDKKIKTDIAEIKDATSTIMKLKPVMFKYTEDWKNKHPSIEDKYYYNFIAQDFQEVFPDFVYTSDESVNTKDPQDSNILSIDAYPAQITLIKAFQEQQNKIAELEQRIAELETK